MSKRLGVAVLVTVVAVLTLSRGMTWILRHRPRPAIDVLRKVFGRLNPVLLWFADRVGMEQPVLYHRGRTSGREYSTPLCVSRTPEGFVVPAAFGPHVDWLANLRATPRAKLRIEGVTHTVDAEIIDAAEAVRIADGMPHCSCWEDLDVEVFAVLRPVADAPGEVVGRSEVQTPA